MSGDDIIITGAQNIEHARWLAVRSALSLEIKGMKRRGRSARVLANEITGHHHGNAIGAYVALDEHIAMHLGEQFRRALLCRRIRAS